MRSKPKRRNSSLLKFIVVACVLGVGAPALGAQVYQNLTAQVGRHAVMQVTASPSAAPSRSPTPSPSATAKPSTSATPKAAPRPVARAPKVLPAVAPAPGSSVDHLVAVAPAVAPSPSPTAIPTASPSASPTSSPTPSPSATPTPATIRYTSSNWSGYMSPERNFTAVSGSWTVPSVSGNGVSTTSDAAWVGIGGVTSSDLIQVGTDDTVSRSGRVTVTAFYELLPASESPIPSMTVMPGDVMSADIHLISGNQWQINLQDVTRGESFSITVTYASTQSSAEWIQEDPSFASGGLVPFDNFGSISFTGAQAVSGGVSQTAAAAGAQAIAMVNGSGHIIAMPSVLGSDGQSFTVTAN